GVGRQAKAQGRRTLRPGSSPGLLHARRLVGGDLSGGQEWALSRQLGPSSGHPRIGQGAEGGSGEPRRRLGGGRRLQRLALQLRRGGSVAPGVQHYLERSIGQPRAALQPVSRRGEAEKGGLMKIVNPANGMTIRQVVVDDASAVARKYEALR